MLIPILLKCNKNSQKKDGGLTSKELNQKLVTLGTHTEVPMAIDHEKLGQISKNDQDLFDSDANPGHQVSGKTYDT